MSFTGIANMGEMDKLRRSIVKKFDFRQLGKQEATDDALYSPVPYTQRSMYGMGYTINLLSGGFNDFSEK